MLRSGSAPGSGASSGGFSENEGSVVLKPLSSTDRSSTGDTGSLLGRTKSRGSSTALTFTQPTLPCLCIWLAGTPVNKHQDGFRVSVTRKNVMSRNST